MAGRIDKTHSGAFINDVRCDNGKCFWFTADAKKYTAPAVASASYHVRIVNAGAFGAQLLTFDLNGSDSLEGPGVTASDGAGYINTKITARRGDFMEFELVDAAGYSITAKSGTWVRE